MTRIASMTSTQQSAALPDGRPSGLQPGWLLERGQALTLLPQAMPRWVRVVEGEVWLTLTARDGRGSDDWWLLRGDRWMLPSGAAAVLEARGRARFELLELPEPVSASRTSDASPGWRRLPALLRRWVQRASFEPQPTCPAA